MLYSHVVRCLSTTTSAIQGYQIAFFQTCRAYSSRSTNESEEADFDAARAWYRNFTRNTLPTKIAKTSYSKSSGPGGQKTNKYVIPSTTLLLSLSNILKDEFESDNGVACAGSPWSCTESPPSRYTQLQILRLVIRFYYHSMRCAP